MQCKPLKLRTVKKLFATMLMMLAISAQAQDIYSVGYYNSGGGTIGALYKNGKRLYIAHYGNQTSLAKKVACNSQGDAYWLVDFYDYPSNTFNHSEIRINNQIYSSTENHNEVHITDMYCLNDTIYCVGYQYNEDSVMVATVWYGNDFSTHCHLGDGIHPSYVYDADIDKSTGIPYFCGYISAGSRKAAVWENQDTLFTFNTNQYVKLSVAEEISVDNGHVYTLGYRKIDTGDGWSFYSPTIWKDNSVVFNGSDLELIWGICAYNGDYYYIYEYPHGMQYWVMKNSNNGVMQFYGNSGGHWIKSTESDIYMSGFNASTGCIWKNFEVFQQIENCDGTYDFEIIDEIHDVAENGTSTGSGAFAVYPNPADDVLFVRTHAVRPYEEYRITNLMGQNLLQGRITAENQRIDISGLPTGMYFITIGETTQKFVAQ